MIAVKVRFGGGTTGTRALDIVEWIGDIDLSIGVLLRLDTAEMLC